MVERRGWSAWSSLSLAPPSIVFQPMPSKVPQFLGAVELYTLMYFKDRTILADARINKYSLPCKHVFGSDVSTTRFLIFHALPSCSHVASILSHSQQAGQ